MGKVVQLRPRKAATTPAAYSEPFLAAWSSFPESGRLRSSRKVSWPEWLKTLAEIDEEALLAAVQRYAREDKEHRKDHGAPGFDRWLKWGRWDNWTGGSASALLGKTFADEKIRKAVVLATSESFAASYLDQCEMDGTTLLVKTDFAIGKLKEKASVFRALGFTGMRKL